MQQSKKEKVKPHQLFVKLTTYKKIKFYRIEKARKQEKVKPHPLFVQLTICKKIQPLPSLKCLKTKS